MKKISKVFSEYYIMFAIYCLIGWLYEVLWMWFVVPPFKFTNRGVLFGPFLPIYGFGMLILIILLKKLMSRKHKAGNTIFLSLSVAIITTFTYVTFIEFTTPKIYRVDLFLKGYGRGLLLANIISIVIANFIVKKSKNEYLKDTDLTIFLVFLAIWIITTLIEYVSHYAIDKYANKLLWDYTYDFLNINARVNGDASRNFAIGGTFLLYTVQPLILKLNKKLKDKTKLIITLVIGIPMLLDFIFHALLHII